jgi:hypothetical protein
LYRLNRNAPITIESGPLRRRASRPEPDTAGAVFIVEDGCGRFGRADLAGAARNRGRNARWGRALRRKPRVTESRAADLTRKGAARFVSV